MDIEEEPFLGNDHSSEDSHDSFQKRPRYEKRTWIVIFSKIKPKNLFQWNSMAVMNVFAILVNLYWAYATWEKLVVIDHYCPTIPYCK
jgi:hypothetical protein